MSFKKVNSHPNFAEIEEEILEFWKKNKIFEKSLEKNSGGGKFVFYEGPPTANGKPGIHHVLARSFKDLIPRYQTMLGKKVSRRAGWDTHGLPVEIEVEKTLGLKNKKEIENYGIARFNQMCRESVWKYKTEWENLTERIGFWIDLKNPYVTYENDYIEKVWGILKEIWQKGLIYSGYFVVPYCPRCGTTLSSHEVAQGYRNIEEESIYVKFKEKNSNTNFLVWTTTPWTLPGNSALAVGKDITYCEVEFEGEKYILAKEKIDHVFFGAKIISEFKGQDLVGKSYEPLYRNEFQKENPNDWKIYAADFVSTDEGTGIVHIAPAFGEDDMELHQKSGVSVLQTVDLAGLMLVYPGKGLFVKDSNLEIKKELEARQILFKKENIKHDYPFCWRCESMLIYYAKQTWFIRMSEKNIELLKNNETITWVPDYIKEGRFGDWLKNARDWAISRERFWGTPLPIWSHQIDKSEIRNSKSETETNNCQNIEVIGSLEELREKAINDIDFKKLDLHKPYIDEIELKCEKCGGNMQRVPEVLDVWFDSGAMPFASGEYPENFPADFISEAIDQTRGWFYMLLAISTLLDKGAPFRNVICLAHVLDDKGKKMSKSKGNVIDPWEVINSYGADSLRWFFYTVNGPGEPKKMNAKNVEQTLRQFIVMWWNIYSFFAEYANVDGWTPEKKSEKIGVLDLWVTKKLEVLNKEVSENLNKFNVTMAARLIEDFVINDLSTWYLRQSRKRRSLEFYQTLYDVLKNLSKICAPFVPFTSEEIYQNLKAANDPESVHLEGWPQTKNNIDDKIISEMAEVRELSEIAHSKRAEQKIRLRQPLSKAVINKSFDQEYLEILSSEINVKKIETNEGQKEKLVLNTEINDELKREGTLREISRTIQGFRKKSGLNPSETVVLEIGADEFLEKIITEFKEKLEKETTSKIEIKNENLGESYKIDDNQIWLNIKA